MPPRPSPLEEPLFSNRILRNEQAFHTDLDWTKAPPTWTQSAVAKVICSLRPDLLRRAPALLPFLLGKHDISDDGDDGVWSPKRGIYGMGTLVGLWVKHNATQQLVDEMVIKQTPYNKLDDIKPFVVGQGISAEAVYQVELQRKTRRMIRDNAYSDFDGLKQLNGNILHLRQYKFNTELKRNRFYLTFAPHGTIDDLFWKYRLMQRSVPESFLWYLVHSLARACRTMNGPLDGPSLIHEGLQEPRNGGEYMIHTDIKSMNVALDYARLEDDEELDKIYQGTGSLRDFTLLYPSVKVMDFGLVHYTSPRTPENPRYCTEVWKPPEMTGWGRDFQSPPNPQGMKMDSKFMVWAIAKIVWDAIMDDAEQVMYETLRDMYGQPRSSRRAETEYIRLQNHFLDRFAALSATSYSPELIRLLYEGLRPSAAARLSLYEMHRQSREWLENWNTSLQNESLDDILEEHRLYFRGNEIVQLGTGSRQVIEYYPAWVKYEYQDPEHPMGLPRHAYVDAAEQQQYGTDPPRRVTFLPNAIKFGDPSPSAEPATRRIEAEEAQPVANPNQAGQAQQQLVQQQPVQQQPAPQPVQQAVPIQQIQVRRAPPLPSPGQAARAAQYEGMNIRQLRTEIRNRGIATKLGGRGVTANKLRGVLRANDDVRRRARDLERMRRVNNAVVRSV
ncbi:uncharacterized protein AB675_11748 [Cyphellophora attinorum]|uniref:Protein kinase domain-containing protein n=1 Tax=Cyphellophora attinorum TaxID=1664694 RepID=A0A0N1HNZ4_9EURO|nr:uncharacterized protein AB675_11748 [Phialophora attinorum]KPI36874.1 hypothetical protein AB675_11748 [Phialophora attinorum]